MIFKDLPRAPPFSSRTLLSRIDADFDRCRTQLIDELARTCSTIALSLDVWTSENNKAILGVTGHWVSTDFKHQERVLEFSELPGSPSGENVAETLQKMLVELRIEEKLLTITADNASINETLASALYLNLSKKYNSVDSNSSDKGRLRFQGIDSYIRCLANVLNLLVRDILSGMKSRNHTSAVEASDLLQGNEKIGRQSALARIRMMTFWILKTPQRRRQWKATCQANGLNDKFIECDVETRWNSTYRMVQGALQAKAQIEKWIEHQNQFSPFSANDWLQLQQLGKILSKFDEFTQLVSRRQSLIRLVIPIYYELNEMLGDAASARGDFSGLSPDVTSAISAGMKKYTKYYELMDAQDAYYIALVLDPRLKALLLDKELGPVAAAKVIRSIKDTLHKQYPSKSLEQSRSKINQDNKWQSLEERILQKYMIQHSDIDRYFEEDAVTLDRSVTKDEGWLLAWWRTHSDEYPRMAAAARDYLAIPVAGVAVERLFSRAKDLSAIRQRSLRGETMRKVMLLEDVYNFETSE
ncbi:uncharacterized protein N7515_007667 [Penicillium bovifimosum]|uniref:HAT C-terminal dimerisation domain-containing protein n=1 Tax=Penicillium bovifimosum TaxID=126998 RepID=A0A9W9GMP3_9EURO|nr:uncharacterized protein N7515_007667 [Penicillium bovifimosum]KAJ5123842.1 hypothetical protein N7515_007667 [Penicillium bovifimosum]